METKWIAIAVVGVFTAMFAPLAVEMYSKNQCKIAYAATNHSAEEIAKVCGR